jgi:hypothetical protein
MGREFQQAGDARMSVGTSQSMSARHAMVAVLVTAIWGSTFVAARVGSRRFRP